jgi:hypothetical protein
MEHYQDVDEKILAAELAANFISKIQNISEIEFWKEKYA